MLFTKNAIYSNYDVQRMLEKSHDNMSFGKKVLDKINDCSAWKAIQDVISSRDYETFERYDPDVRRQFVAAFEEAIKEEREINPTIVISAFPGCGKTYLFNHQGEYGFSIHDSDSSKFKGDGWEEEYVKYILKNIQSNKYDFIFVSQHEKVLNLLNEHNVTIAKVIPRTECKEEYFNRYKNRNNDHIEDMSKFLNVLDKNWDNWTSEENMRVGNPKYEIWLNPGKYLADVILENFSRNNMNKEDEE